jgi:Mn2+/Fe2+ NRAMP family transporter
MNLVMLAQAVFSPLGLITGWVLMERYNVTRWYRWFLIFLAVTSPMLTVVALLVGLADATYDLRSRWRQTAAASPAPASDLVGRRP